MSQRNNALAKRCTLGVQSHRVKCSEPPDKGSRITRKISAVIMWWNAELCRDRKGHSETLFVPLKGDVEHVEECRSG